LALIGAASLPGCQTVSPAELTAGGDLGISQVEPSAILPTSESQIAAATEEPNSIELVINDHRSYYKEIENNEFSDVGFDEFSEYLRELAEAVSHVLSNPTEFAQIATEVIVDSGLKIGAIVGIFIIEKSKKAIRGRPNRYIDRTTQGFQELQGFFKEHSEASLSVIASKTGMDKKEVSLLLRLGEVYGTYRRRPNGNWRCS